MQGTVLKVSPGSEREPRTIRVDQVVLTAKQFETVVADSLPILFDRAGSQIKQFLRKTGQWRDDIAHEKFMLRWASEYIEQFLVYGRLKVPCRPFFLFDAFVARQHSQSEPFCYYPHLLTPLGRLIDGLLERTAVSRDALINLYFHCYGLLPGQVIAVLGLEGSQSQRIYKNFYRWRISGWQRTLKGLNITDNDLITLEQRKLREPAQFNSEVTRLVRLAQQHYRKSEPAYYHCPSIAQWHEMFEQSFGHEYRIWHLALCMDCLLIAWDWNDLRTPSMEGPGVNFHIRP